MPVVCMTNCIMCVKIRRQKIEMENRKWKIKHTLLVLCLLLLFFTSHFSPVNAADPANKLSEIKGKIKAKLQQIKEVKEKEKAVFTQINDINKSINEKEVELRRYDKQMSNTQSQMLNLSNEINVLTEKLDRRQQYLDEQIRAIYKHQYGSNALMLVTVKDYQDLVRKSKYISLVAYHNSKVINSYKDELQEINSRKRKLEGLQEKLKINKGNVQKKKHELQTNRVKKDKLLATIKSKRISYEKRIRELERSSKKIQYMVKGLKAKKIPTSIIGKGFKSLKGNLPWPVNGKVLTPYGRYNEPKYNISILRNGIEINANPEDKAKAIAGGRVVYVGRVEDYGMLLIVDHGSGYHSLYGNLSEMFFKKDELLVKGMDVGKVSKSKLLNVPALYFEIRYQGKPLNPMEWLKRRT